MAVVSLSLHAARSSPSNSVRRRRVATERSDVSRKGTAARTVGVHDKNKIGAAYRCARRTGLQAQRDAKYGSDTVGSIARSRPTALPSSTSAPSAGTQAASKDPIASVAVCWRRLSPCPGAALHDRLSGIAVECEGQ